MNKEDFRIKEIEGRFIIEKKVLVVKRIFKIFNVKTYYDWITYDDNVFWKDRIVNPTLKSGFPSLEAAKERLQRILEKPKYHYL